MSHQSDLQSVHHHTGTFGMTALSMYMHVSKHDCACILLCMLCFAYKLLATLTLGTELMPAVILCTQFLQRHVELVG